MGPRPQAQVELPAIPSAAPEPRDAIAQPLAGRRILIIVENLPVPFDRRVWQEATSLARHGAQVTVICPQGRLAPAPHEVIDGVSIYRHRLPLEAAGARAYLLEYGAALLAEAWLAFKVFRRHGFDAIQLCNPPDLLFLVGLPYKLLGRKLVFDHHDLTPELYEAKFGRRGLLHRLLLAFERASFRFADLVISTNESYREIALRRGNVPHARVTVVRSGPDTERIRLLPPQPDLKRGKRYLLGYVGVIGHQEGIDHLLEAMRLLVFERGRDDLHCIVCGDGPALQEMKRLASSLHLGDVVEFVGRVPDAELLAVLNTADVAVNPDVWNEMNDKSTMNKIMEYMTLGKPIVQYDLKEGRYSAQEASLYARPNDPTDLARCIEALLADPLLRDRMGSAGRRRVLESLNWKVEEPKLIAAYCRLFGVSDENPA